MSTHTLNHALRPAATNCQHGMKDITECVMCGRRLRPNRKSVDTCSKVCLNQLSRLQAQS